MIDRNYTFLFVPFLGCRIRIWNEGANPRITRHVIAENRSRNLTCEHHLIKLLAWWNPVAIRWILVFGQMRLVNRQPGHLVQIDAIFVLQNSADPESRCLCVGSHADLAALDVLRLQFAVFNAVAYAMMLKASGYRSWKK